MKNYENKTQDGPSSEESDDQGPYFDDIISPGEQHINFGTFQDMEIKKYGHFRSRIMLQL